VRCAARIVLVLVLAAVVLPAVASACPLCKDAKSDTDYAGGSASLPKGFYYSILLMVSAPFAVVGGLAVRILLARRSVARANTAVSPREVTPAGSAAAPPARLVPDSRGARP
jgi:hypothetical protein